LESRAAAGYKVVRPLFDSNGKPTGEYEDFMTGFVISNAQVWGRPVGIAVAQDGSLFVTENGKVRSGALPISGLRLVDGASVTLALRSKVISHEARERSHSIIHSAGWHGRRSRGWLRFARDHRLSGDD
jgi:hypothetical protein